MKSIVIGSGFGGIAAALRLRAKNHKVTLIEKIFFSILSLSLKKGNL